MNIVGIIPARMASTRFQGKPLAKILGIPMLGHVYFRSRMSVVLNDLYVATCDQEIINYVHSIDGKAIMTADTHERASDRTAEAMLKIESETGNRIDFSREPIPSWKKGAKTLPMLKQICIIPFQHDFLIKFNQLEPTPLEIVESVDMLRILEHGYKVKMILTNKDTYSVDTITDLKRAEKIMEHDPLIKKYRFAK